MDKKQYKLCNLCGKIKIPTSNDGEGILTDWFICERCLKDIDQLEKPGIKFINIKGTPYGPCII